MPAVFLKFLQRLSVRNRLFLGTASMLLPLLAAFAVSISSMNLIVAVLDEVAVKSTEEIPPVYELSLELQQVSLLLSDREQQIPVDAAYFNEVMARVDEGFRTLRQGPAPSDTESAQIEVAAACWNEARLWLAAATARLEQPGASASPRLWRDARDALEAAIGHLDDLLDLRRADLSDQLRFASQVRTRNGALIAVTVALGVFMALLFGHLVAHTILRPLKALEEGAERFGKGELVHRVEVPERDELGRLAQSFNRMASRLDRSYRALRRLSTRDYLTSLRNTREFYRLLALEEERAQRYGKPFALMIIDIDHFKQFNDRFGHQFGDRVLREVAHRIQAEVRTVDIAARIGGEEFAVILPETGGEAALALGERVRQAVSRSPLALASAPESELRVTVSVGVAAFPTVSESGRDLFHAADMALYRAKEGGRNRVCAAA